MKYIRQFLIILAVSFAGEMLHYFIPLPIPASIYGLGLMLALLCTHVLKIGQIEKTADFLIEIMPLMFIPGGVGLVTVWADLKPIIVPVAVITVAVTVIVMAVTGKSAELVMYIEKRRKRKNEQHND
jgi:holin-like protein